MECLRRQDLKKLFHTVEELYALQSLESFPRRVLSAIRNLIPSSAYSSCCVINRKLKTVTTLCEPVKATQLVRRHDGGFDALLHEHPLVAHDQKVSDHVIKLSDFYNRVRLHNTALYKEYYKKTGVEFQIVFSIPSSPYRTAFALNRSNRDFTERERLILISLRPWLIKLYHHLYKIAQSENKAAILQVSIESEGKGLILLSPEDEPTFFTPQAQEWMKAYFAGNKTWRKSLPEKLRKWIVRQRKSAGISRTGTPFVVQKKIKRLRISLFNSGTQGSLLKLTEEYPEMSFRKTVRKSFGLSPRETEVVSWVIKGKTSSEIGMALCLSHRTVEKHLERIYAKLGVENRAGAIARLFEASFDRHSKFKNF